MSSRKLRVLTLVAYPGTFGGGERLASDIARRLDPARYERTLCVTRWPEAGTAEAATSDAWARQLVDDGVRVLLLRRTSRSDLLAWRPVIRLLAGGHVDIIHSHMFGANVTGVTLGRLFRVPVVIAHEHSWSFSGGMIRTGLDRWLIARGSDAFIAVSNEDRRRMIELEHIPSRHVTFVANGIPDPELSASPLSRADVGLAEDELVLMSVGVIRPEKRFESLVEAAAMLRDRLPQLRIVIVGPDLDGSPAPRELRAAIEDRGLADVVKLLGPRLDVASLLPLADVAACVSEREGSPLTVMEYMAAGLPVISSRVGGLADLIEAGRGGVLFEPGDVGALADAIVELAEQPDSRRRMGEFNRERQQSRYTIGHTVARIETLYTDLYPQRRAG